MADDTEIAALRRMTEEPDDTAPYTDELLAALIDAGTTLESVAAGIWREKAAKFSSLIDVQEGSSVRKMTQLRTNALAMADTYGGGTVAESSAPVRASRMRAITRV